MDQAERTAAGIDAKYEAVLVQSTSTNEVLGFGVFVRRDGRLMPIPLMSLEAANGLIEKMEDIMEKIDLP